MKGKKIDKKLQQLIDFVGLDFVLGVKERAKANADERTLEITGFVLGGDFKLTIHFDFREEAKH
jgi:hypothetical protein